VGFSSWQLASGSAQCGFGPRRRRVDHIVVFCVCMPLVVRPKVALSLCFRFCRFVPVRRPNHGTAHPHRCVVVCVFVHVLCVCVCMCVLQVATPRMCWPHCKSRPQVALSLRFRILSRQAASDTATAQHTLSHVCVCVCVFVCVCVSVCLCF
jgi:hypothetical protein